MSHQQKAPSHGTKVTDPSSVNPERTGPVPQESLASESLRSGGAFAANTKVSGQDVPPTTTTGEAAKVFEGKKPESPLLGPDEAVKSKAGLTGTAGGGKQRVEAFEGSAGSGQVPGSSVGYLAELQSGTVSGGDQERAKYSAAPGSGGMKHERHGFDWSKVPKEMRDTTDIGSGDDPGRAGEQHMLKKTAQHGGPGGEGDWENQYTALKGDESI